MGLRLEVATVYKDLHGQLWLALSEDRAIGFVRGQWSQHEPGAQWSPERDLSFEQLCWTWGVSGGELDALSAVWFPRDAPSDSVPPSRVRTAKTPGAVYRLAQRRA